LGRDSLPPEGCGPEALYAPARELVPHAELLAICNLFMENCVFYVTAFAVLSVVGIWLYDEFKPRWTTASFALGLLLTFTLYVLVFHERYDKIDLLTQEIGRTIFAWLPLGCFTGIISVAITWSVRKGLWIAALYSRRCHCRNCNSAERSPLIALCDYDV
jgi:hypothetical protein